MIARIEHPKDPSRHAFLALVYERQIGAWVPLMASQAFHTAELDAARACHAEWLPAWRNVQRLARQARTLCEHPGFADMVGDGIEAETVADSVQQLATAVSIADFDISCLFDNPGPNDEIRIAGALYHCDPRTRLLTQSRDPDQGDPTQSPDDLLIEAIYSALHRARARTHQEVTARGLEQAIDALILMLPDIDDRVDPRDPAQLIADHRFTRFIAHAARRSYERTGQRVSARGIRHTIAVLERIMQDRGSSNGSGTIQEIDHEPTIELDSPDDEPPDDDSESSDESGSGGNTPSN